MNERFDRQGYAIVTGAYWAFTLTDGALRMLVLLHFHDLGYTPLQLAFLFLLYEFCGILTNLFGGWIGSRTGLKATLFAGLAIQIVALVMLSFVNASWVMGLSVAYVMAAQALSGVAKDLTKMSSKSAVKLLVEGPGAGGGEAEQQRKESRLFRWVAVLTGSKNALKGVGFFLGGLLLHGLGFQAALWALAGLILLALLLAASRLRGDLGRSKAKIKFTSLFSKSAAVNRLSFARVFLFAARDVWFVVGLPVFLYETLGWSFTGVGAFMAAWVIGYGFVQAAAPRLLGKEPHLAAAVRASRIWGLLLAILCGVISLALTLQWQPVTSLLAGLALFGVVFAVNSAVHSYLILAYTDQDQVALNVGFYYMANACGRLAGTLLSGLVFLMAGLTGCLWIAAALSLVAALVSFAFPSRLSLSTRQAGLVGSDASTVENTVSET